MRRAELHRQEPRHPRLVRSAEQLVNRLQHCPRRIRRREGIRTVRDGDDDRARTRAAELLDRVRRDTPVAEIHDDEGRCLARWGCAGVAQRGARHRRIGRRDRLRKLVREELVGGDYLQPRLRVGLGQGNAVVGALRRRRQRSGRGDEAARPRSLLQSVALVEHPQRIDQNRLCVDPQIADEIAGEDGYVVDWLQVVEGELAEQDLLRLPARVQVGVAPQWQLLMLQPARRQRQGADHLIDERQDRRHPAPLGDAREHFPLRDSVL